MCHNEQQDHLNMLKEKLAQQMAARRFKSNPKDQTATVNVTLDDHVAQKTKISGVSIRQIPCDNNDGTTGHKLPSISNEQLIAVDWAFIANWVYIVLSCVHTLNGLYLLKELSLSEISKLLPP